MSKPTDELTALNDAASKMSEAANALQEQLKKRVTDQSNQLSVENLRSEIQREKVEIETLKTLAQANGKEPDVDDRLRSLKEKERKLEELEAKYGIPPEPTRRKRRWEFWK